MTQTMHTTDPAARQASDRFLRLVLRIDSVSTAVMATVLIAAYGPLGSATGMPVGFSVGFGLYQLGGAASLALIAGYPVIPAGLAKAVIGVNLGSAVACLVVAAGDLVPLTGFGIVFMLIGAVVVGVYAALQWVGLRRMTAAG
ncbi:hypothetical protein OG429_31280 [Streptomyces sp. NBC_00190]|uniref:hypothetical protein n=1 Tax=unclassified Streptomyces TaxID=2593676 RepID=UPI002E2AE74B|nr:hypothetical protein [Streptomyces sp. NBC_00190]WSZ43375.1 hypothetical protein OG239_33850 [Streptomyces sp. NBC_00868]